MINLAGIQNCDKTILEELYLANVKSYSVNKENTEVPYSYIGKIGNWKLTRAWNYWVAKVEFLQDGLPLKLALELHNKKHSIENYNLGEIIRSGGHCGCPSPDEYGAQPVYNDELDEKLINLGYKKVYWELLKKEYIPITVGEISKLCNEGKLDVERYVECYHIDSQIGLNEFVKFIKENEQI